MQKLRGSGNSFSTSGKRWWPFAYGNRNRKVSARNAKLHKLRRAGKLPVLTKDDMRQQLAELFNAKR